MEPTTNARTKGFLPLPSDLKAEKATIAGLFLRPEMLEAVTDTGIRDDDFYDPRNRTIFSILREKMEQGQRMDNITLRAALAESGVVEQVGGDAYLNEIMEEQFSAYNVAAHAQIVHERGILRRLVEACRQVSDDAVRGVPDLQTFLDSVEARILRVAQGQNSNAFKNLKDVAHAALQEIELAYTDKRDVAGLATEFHDWDRMTTGFRPGQLIIIAARPGIGKTSLFLSIAQNIARARSADKESERKVIGIFSLEMSAGELVMRVISSLSGVSAKALRQGRVSEQGYRTIAQDVIPFIDRARMFFDDSGSLTVRDIRSRCRRLKNEQKRLDLVVVDYLQLMEGSGRGKGDHTREREISEISRGLKALAKELQVPIIALSQLNRGVESRPDKRPMLSDLRESGAIEQDADMVCFIYRDEFYNKESPDKGVAELIVAKHRAGETGTIRLAWKADLTRFENLDERHAPPAEFHPRYPEKGDRMDA